MTTGVRGGGPRENFRLGLHGDGVRRAPWRSGLALGGRGAGPVAPGASCGFDVDADLDLGVDDEADAGAAADFGGANGGAAGDEGASVADFDPVAAGDD